MFGLSIPSLYDLIYAYKNYEGEVKQIEHNLRSMKVSFDSVLELATGTGCYLEHFGCEQKFGIDICEESLMYASFRVGGASFKNFDITKITPKNCPFSINKFDLIVGLFGAVGYVSKDQLQSSISNWLDLLSQDGVLILEPWHEHPKVGEYHHTYRSKDIEIHRQTEVLFKPELDNQTIMDFSYTIEQDGRTKKLHRREYLYSHSFHELKSMIEEHCNGLIVHTDKSSFSNDGQWYIKKKK